MKKRCNSKVKHTCASKNYATCISYETPLPTFSEIGDCADLDQTTEELYNLVGESQLSGLGEKCLEYVEENGKIIVRNVLLKYEEEICALKEKVQELENTDICNKNITSCNFNFGTLVDICGNQPTTMGEVIQLLLNQHNT